MEKARSSQGLRRKLLAVICAAALLLGAAVQFAPMPASAVNPETATVTVKNVTDAEAAVTLYPIVEGVYDSTASTGSLTGYQLASWITTYNSAQTDESAKLTIADTETWVPTEAELAKIAAAVRNGAAVTGTPMTPETADGERTGTFTATMDAGEYLVLVTGADATVYNPAVVSVSKSGSTAAAGGTTDMTTKFGTGDTAYLKSSSSGFDKDIEGSGRGAGTTGNTTEPVNAKGDTVQVGDRVYFELSGMTIPDYSDDYSAINLTYSIGDTLESTSFTGVNDLAVYVGGTAESNRVEPTSGTDTNYTLTGGTSSDTTFTIAFSDAYIRANGGKSVTVTYSSVIADTAGYNFDENLNHATLAYSRDPNDPSSLETLAVNTYHYTFAIDAGLNGTDSEQTYELNKVTAATGTDESYVYVEGDRTYRPAHPLTGAQFQLYSDPSCADAYKVGSAVTTDGNGHFTITGLDAASYYLKEIAAPSGYSLNANIYRVDISATLNSDGTLQSYTVTVCDVTDAADKTTDTSKQLSSWTYTADTHTIGDDGEVTYTSTGTDTITKTGTPGEIVDPKLNGLPSTGGAGTVLLTVCAAGGMAVCLAVYLRSRKKDAE